VRNQTLINTGPLARCRELRRTTSRFNGFSSGQFPLRSSSGRCREAPSPAFSTLSPAEGDRERERGPSPSSGAHGPYRQNEVPGEAKGERPVASSTEPTAQVRTPTASFIPAQAKGLGSWPRSSMAGQRPASSCPRQTPFSSWRAAALNSSARMPLIHVYGERSYRQAGRATGLQRQTERGTRRPLK
jgi:hypothetical protein